MIRRKTLIGKQNLQTTLEMEVNTIIAAYITLNAVQLDKLHYNLTLR
jgi:hypothetical protein